MTLQWTVVAVFLYAEIAFLLLLLLPWIRPHVWNKVFRSRLIRALETYSHLYAYAGAGVLVLLFFDAIREVRKYHTADLSMEVTMHTANSDAVIHMRLFRAQRNLYISGFALFLWLVIRRMIQLISHEAQLMASAEAAMKQARNASDTASRLMDDQDDKQTSKHIEQLKAELKSAQLDRDTMKEQAHNLQIEYDRLATEFTKLDKKAAGTKKDD